MSKLDDLEGQPFGRWTVGRRAPNRGNGQARWHVTCVCGQVGIALANNLKAGTSTQCKVCRDARNVRRTVVVKPTPKLAPQPEPLVSGQQVNTLFLIEPAVDAENRWIVRCCICRGGDLADAESLRAGSAICHTCHQINGRTRPAHPPAGISPR